MRAERAPAGLACALGVVAQGADFADQLHDFRPAPGQFINGNGAPMDVFNDPMRALGAPIGGGILAPSNSKVVSLGGFGGTILLGFSETVEDGSCNPFGLDAIVFGNAFWAGGNPASGFREPGVIEISLDVNGNGQPDDAWYLIPGTVIPNSPPPPPPGTVPNDVFTVQTWDNDPGTQMPPVDVSWYPDDAIYGFVPPGFPSSYDTWGWLLSSGSSGVGYSDQTPTLLLGDLDGDDVVDDPEMEAEDFYTCPDNPWDSVISPGSGGGDAFDVAWAVDPATGEAVNLGGFDFIRISTGENGLQLPLGERSAEVGGVAASRGRVGFFDVDGSGVVGVEDLYRWHEVPSDLTGEGVSDTTDRWLLQRCVRRDEAEHMAEGRE